MMIYVFDIDGTICSNTSGDYQSAMPNFIRINRINNLFDEGSQIILFTARGMGSSNNDVQLAIMKWEEFTKKQLKEWGVKYHLLFMGKPSGDLYIDDKGINDQLFFDSKNE